MFGTLKTLVKHGVLGINKRNAEFTLKYNLRKFYPNVDNKLITKRLAKEAGVAVPELYGVVKYTGEVKSVLSQLRDRPDFVIKPCCGSGGEGIIVVSGRPKGLFRTSGGTILSEAEVSHHMFNILNGMFSLGAHPDQVIVEYRVRFDPVFSKISYQGVPDIRIIVFCGVPVMSMVRLPTQMSRGKANLHQGAIGAGINIASGITTTAVWKNDIIDSHPDTGHSIVGVEIPQWPRLLALASRCYELTKIAYQGVDLVLDQDLGPLLLEVNARPGLNVQIANKAGLLPRLREVEANLSELDSVEKRLAFAREHFKTSPTGYRQ